MPEEKKKRAGPASRGNPARAKTNAGNDPSASKRNPAGGKTTESNGPSSSKRNAAGGKTNGKNGPSASKANPANGETKPGNGGSVSKNNSGGGQTNGKNGTSVQKENPRTGRPSDLQKRYEAALAENEKLAAKVRALEEELKSLRRITRTPGAPASNDADLQAALAQSGLRAEDILTHYNHGRGRIVLVPKTGPRIVVEPKGRSEKESGP